MRGIITDISEPYPFNKRVKYRFLFLKIWELTFKGEAVPSFEYTGIDDIDRAIKSLNQAYLLGIEDMQAEYLSDALSSPSK